MTEHNIALARQTAERVSGIKIPFGCNVTDGAILSVTLKDQQAAITAPDVNALTRAFFLLCRAVKEQKTSLSIREERHIESCGAMIDCSRNAVMRAEAVKRYIDVQACLGLNLLMLYTEDTYQVPGYPRMGYLRGRYSLEELHEIDDYAYSLGVELVPCIQTLGHMQQFLQWPENAPLRDQRDVLLCDYEPTYELIEAAIRGLRSCLRSSRIHIGMDEAHGVGLGRYYQEHGSSDRFELLNRHLGRVIDICRKYDYEPMMWSDMFFRLGSVNNEYYDENAHVPQSVIDSMPPVKLVYWDYYHQDEAFYDRMLSEHERMCGDAVFAGGIWTWSGFLPAVKRTEASMLPAMKACAAHGVNTVLATLWGDDGAETNYSLSVSLLPIFSESVWEGPDANYDDMVTMGEYVSGFPRKVLDAMGDFYQDARDIRTGKGLIWCDILYPLLDPVDESWDDLISRFEDARRTVQTTDTLECRFAAALFDVSIRKAEILQHLRPAYLAGEKDALQEIVEERIPELMAVYDELMHLHRNLWERDNKRFGWEVMALRYGSVMGRLTDAAEEIERYLSGELKTIEELDAEPINQQRFYWYSHLVTPMAEM